MTWKSYTNDRLMFEHPSGFVIIKPSDASETVDIFCAVCDHALRSRDDEIAWREFQCCDRCARTWAAPRREAWKGGWRPTNEQVMESEADRLPLVATLNID
jgi:hypothetical protein